MATPALGTVVHHLRHSLGCRDGAALADGELLECFLRHKDEASFEALVFGVCRRVAEAEMHLARWL